MAEVAAVALLLAVGVLATVQLVAARHHLLLGVRELRSAQDAARLGPTDTETAFGRTRHTLQRAEGEFESARSDLSLWSPLLVRLGWMPLVGDQLAAAPPAADAALYTTRSALHLVDGLSRLWPAIAPGAPRKPLSKGLAAALRLGHGQFLAAASDADRAALALHHLPDHSGIASLDAGRRELRDRIPILRTASRWLAAAPVLLGDTRPSHYLVVLQDPAELRATGGFIGAADFVTVRDGSISSLFTSSALPHEIDSVATPLPEALYTAEGPWIFRDANWSPDFSLSARLERWFYGEDTGRWADGVISVLDPAITRILAATGPVYLPPYGVMVDSDNMEALAERYVNGSYHGPSRQGSSDTVRKQFIGDVISALMQRLQSLPRERWPALLQAVSESIARREIMLYDRRADIETVAAMSGADGRLLPVTGDFLYVVDDNRSYNKLNPYVHEWAEYRAELFPDLRVEATLTIHYQVAPSPPDLEGAGPGFGIAGSKHDYEDFLRVYVPWGARLQQLSGVDRWAPAPGYGFTQFAGRLLLREGQRGIATVRYQLPTNVLAGSSFTRYNLTLRHQPGGNLRSVHVLLSAMQGLKLRVGRGAGRRFQRIIPQDRDAHLTVSLDGAVRAKVVPLVAPHGPIDPYIPFSDFHDRGHPL
jgi:hypothetical protein